jgi:hypothetical protein
MGRYAIMFPQNNKNNFTLLKASLNFGTDTLGLMAAFKITIHQLRRSLRKQVIQHFFLVQNLALLLNLKMTCVACTKYYYYYYFNKKIATKVG